MAPFTVNEATVDDFVQLTDCKDRAFTEPDQPIWRLWCPDPGPDREAREQGVKQMAEREIQWHRNDPASVFLKAVDTEDGKIVGGFLIKLYKTNPFGEGARSDFDTAHWYPEGSQRTYVDEAFKIFTAPHREYMQRPHAYWYFLFVHPEYRRRGIMNLLMAEVARRADEQGLESYIEGVSPMMAPLFMKFGFIPYRELKIQPQREDADHDWKEIDQELSPMSFWPAWRPAKDRDAKHKPTPPWSETAIGWEMTPEELHAG